MSIKIKFPEELMINLEKLANEADKIVEKSLKAGAEIGEWQIRTNLKSSLKGESSGQLLEALGTSPVKPNNKIDGWDVKVGFAEPRKDGTSNAMIANILEYGKKGQAAKPFLKPAIDASKPKMRATMKKVFTAETEKIMKSGGK